jgi:ketosteroid isomerase-like protein
MSEYRRVEVNDAEKSIARVLKSYESAVFSKDVEAFMHLYEPNVRVFDAWGVWSYEGAVAWRLATEGWFTSLGTESVKVTFDEVQTLGGRELFMVSAIATYAGFSAQGEQLRAMQNRITWVLRTSGHNLRIIHEHTSAPIDFNESKAILKRETAT